MKGLLPREGTPDHHEAAPVTRGRSQWSRRPPADLRPVPPRPKAEDTAMMQLSRRRERRGIDQGATGVSEARSHRRRGKTTPTLPTRPTRPSSGDQRSMTIRRSGPGRRETSGPPVNPAEPKTPWGVPAAQAASASREHTRCGYTSFVWVADIGWTHRAPFPPRGRKTSWCSKGASQEEVRSSV